MNYELLNMGDRQGCGLAFGEAVLRSSPPNRSQIVAGVKHWEFPESSFGGWADEKMKTVREAAPMLRPKKNHPQHLTISLEKKWIHLSTSNDTGPRSTR